MGTFQQFGSNMKRSMLLRRKRQLSRQDWKKRYAEVLRRHPEYGASCASYVESSHLEMWRKLRSDVNIETLRICSGISGTCVPEIVPEEVYVSEIEPCLNHYGDCTYIANKSLYGRWFTEDVFPRAFLHNIDGEYFDGDYRPLNAQGVEKVLDSFDYPVLLKPNLERQSGGGKDIVIADSRNELEAVLPGRINYVIQERIRQHPFLDRLNGGGSLGMNTFKVCTYRSVKDNSVHVLNAALRISRSGELDNETAGSITCFVRDDGKLNDYGVGKYGTRFYEHPESHVRFSEVGEIPDFERMKQLAMAIASETYFIRLLSLDIGLDEYGRWRVIEINMFGQTMRFCQSAGVPFFGEFTEEVLDYCAKHPEWR